MGAFFVAPTYNKGEEPTTLMSDRAQRVLLWLFAALLIGATVYGLRYATGYRAAAGLSNTPPEMLPPDVNLRLLKVRAIGRDKGAIAWTVNAGRIDTTRSRDRLQFVGDVQATLLRGNKPHTIFTAPYAEYLTVAKRLRASAIPPASSFNSGPLGAPPVRQSSSGEVVCTVLGKSGRALDDLHVTGQEAIWDVGGKTVVCPGHLKATQGTSVVEGEALTADLATKAFDVRRFHAVWTLDDEETPADALSSFGE